MKKFENVNHDEYVKVQEDRMTTLQHEYPISPWHKYIFEEFKPYLKSPLVDIGCRNGLLLDKLEEEGIESHGIELTELAKFAQSKGRKVIQADIQGKTPFEDKFFKSAVMTHVIEHCYDPEKALQEISRILDGYILIVFPASGLSEEARDKYGHYSAFENIDDLSDLMVKNGFEIVQTINEGWAYQVIIAKTK